MVYYKFQKTLKLNKNLKKYKILKKKYIFTYLYCILKEIRF